MLRWQKYVVSILAICVLAFGAFTFGFAAGKSDRGVTIFGRGEGDSDSIEEAYNEILSRSVEAPDAEELAHGAIKGMIDVLKKKKDGDPYAYFFSPKSYASFQELTTGSFSGIGVFLKVGNDGLRIVSVLPETPALAAGLKRGDLIREIDGRTVRSLDTDEAVALIKGPPGSEVALRIERSGEQMSFDITREEIELPNLTKEIKQDDIGYIRLFNFAKHAGEQVRDAVSDLTDKGATSVVLDLRDNGGGLFDEGIKVASVFIEDGPIVTYREPGSDDVTYDAEGDAFEKLPLVVLVNEGTASASEIVAGALQDSDRAQLIGVTTYGKGSVQQVVELPDDSALKFTTAAYLTPAGTDINGEGIPPDVVVKKLSEQLPAALRAAEGQLSDLGAEG
jgi:carboxyl-terminal processing protease